MVEQALRSCIEQLLDVIDLLPDEIYVAQAAPQDSSIGCHFRHIIEFIQMLREQAPEGCADYERRNRVKVLEQDRSAARLSVKENGRLLLEIFWAILAQTMLWLNPRHPLRVPAKYS